MFNIFVTESVIKSIFASDNDKAGGSKMYLQKIMKMQKRVYVAADSDDTSWAQAFKNIHNIQLDFCKTDYINTIPSHPETVLQNPSSLFILDIPIMEAEKIKISYGVICLSSESIGLSLLLDTNDEYTTNDGEQLAYGWSTVLKSVKSLPSNSLLLTDRYLFSMTSFRAGNGIANTQSILDTLLPSKFLGEYHVTIVFDYECIHESYTFKEIATQLNKLKKSLHRPYPINLEIIGITPDCEIYNKLHNRRIVSNYYIIKVEHKLAAFNKNVGTCLQTITPQLLFTADSLNNHSTPPLKSIDYVISALKKISNIIKTPDNLSIYRYALNGKVMDECTGIKNRLLK